MTAARNPIQSLRRSVVRLWRGLGAGDGRKVSGGSGPLSHGVFQSGSGVAALEISAELEPASPVSTKSVIAQVLFYDAEGRSLDVSAPQLRRSQRLGAYFYPYEYRHGKVFRFVVPAPDVAFRVEVVLRHWHKADVTPYSAGAVSIRPTDLIAAVSGTDAASEASRGWFAERDLRMAIQDYATALTAEVGGLSANETPFGEAVVEHFIFETNNVDLARGLALRRLDAGRDRDALALLPLVSHARLKEAAGRRALLRWADAISPLDEDVSPGHGEVLVVAQSANLDVGSPGLRTLGERGLPLELFAPAPPDAALLSVAAWTPVEPLDTSDASQIVRLADQVVRAGRGRGSRLIWATSVGDALAAAAIGRRLSVPAFYEVADLASWRARFDDVAWRHTDEGQREEALFRGALNAAHRLIVGSAEDRDWLSAFLTDPGRMLPIEDGVAMAGGPAPVSSQSSPRAVEE